MCKDDMVRYIMACGAGESNARPYRISSIFSKYGDNIQETLPFSGFLQFYRDACTERVDVCSFFFF